MQQMSNTTWSPFYDRGTLTGKHRFGLHQSVKTCDFTMQRTNTNLMTDVVENIGLKLLFPSI